MPVTKGWAVPARTVVALLVLTLASAAGAPQQSFAEAVPPVLLAQGGQCGECIQCYIGHKVLGPTQSGVAGLHSCGGASCDDHGSCGITMEATRRAPELFLAIRAAAPNELAEVVEKFGLGAHINLARRSVQVEGCDNTIAVNIPLSDSQVAALVN